MRLLVTMLFVLGGCGGGGAKPCTEACRKLADCTGATTCPLSAVCTEQEKCLALCIDRASCAAISGLDVAAAKTYGQCRAQCGVTVVDAGALDGPPVTDNGVHAEGPSLDAGVPRDSASTLPPDSAPPSPDSASPRPPDSASPPLPDSAPPDQGIVVPPFANVTVAAGIFSMGSPVSEPCREASGGKETLHQVTLVNAFQIGNREVTQGQFQYYMGYNPSNYAFCGKDCPVEMVTWHEAALYCNQISTQQGKPLCYEDVGSGVLCAMDADCQAEKGVCVQAKCVRMAPVATYAGAAIYACPGFRLPTEAEWERACRAGTQGAFYNGGVSSCTGTDPAADQIGWFAANSSSVPHLAGQKQKNALGLYDMAGNVMEWVHDGYTADLGAGAITDPVTAPVTDQRVTRGGAWSRQPGDLRAAARLSYNARDRGGNRGFRCARSLLP